MTTINKGFHSSKKDGILYLLNLPNSQGHNGGRCAPLLFDSTLFTISVISISEVKLPFQGALSASVIFLNPRRCRWAELTWAFSL
jgi:hypothetical protein